MSLDLKIIDPPTLFFSFSKKAVINLFSHFLKKEKFNQKFDESTKKIDKKILKIFLAPKKKEFFFFSIEEKILFYFGTTQ